MLLQEPRRLWLLGAQLYGVPAVDSAAAVADTERRHPRHFCFPILGDDWFGSLL